MNFFEKKYYDLLSPEWYTNMDNDLQADDLEGSNYKPFFNNDIKEGDKIFVYDIDYDGDSPVVTGGTRQYALGDLNDPRFPQPDKHDPKNVRDLHKIYGEALSPVGQERYKIAVQGYNTIPTKVVDGKSYVTSVQNAFSNDPLPENWQTLQQQDLERRIQEKVAVNQQTTAPNEQVHQETQTQQEQEQYQQQDIELQKIKQQNAQLKQDLHKAKQPQLPYDWSKAKRKKKKKPELQRTQTTPMTAEEEDNYRLNIHPKYLNPRYEREKRKELMLSLVKQQEYKQSDQYLSQLSQESQPLAMEQQLQQRWQQDTQPEPTPSMSMKEMQQVVAQDEREFQQEQQQEQQKGNLTPTPEQDNFKPTEQSNQLNPEPIIEPTANNESEPSQETSLDQADATPDNDASDNGQGQDVDVGMDI